MATEFILRLAPFGLRDVDGKTTGPLTLFTTNEEGPFVPTQLIAGVIGIAGFTSVPTMSLGTNSPNFNNIIAATPLTGLNALGKYAVLAIASGTAVPSLTLIQFNITVAAVATTYQLGFNLIGYYV